MLSLSAQLENLADTLKLVNTVLFPSAETLDDSEWIAWNVTGITSKKGKYSLVQHVCHIGYLIL